MRGVAADHHHFSRRRRLGVRDQLADRLRLRADAQGLAGWSVPCADRANIGASARAAGGGTPVERRVRGPTRHRRIATRHGKLAADCFAFARPGVVRDPLAPVFSNGS